MKLKQVLINILSNAIKFTDAPGSVTLSVERTGSFGDQSTLKFVIRDTGIGMDKAFIPKIFDSFTQEDSSRSSKYGSTGLGMAITKNIVELMNGTISVESEKGVGTAFTVVVTLKNCAHRGTPGQFIRPQDMRVLVVDDEEIAAEHARLVLEEVGIQADTCLGGAEALQMLEVQHTKHKGYNLVLLDWKMPEMDGVEVARLIRERYDNETTVIILTAYNWDEIMDEALHAGVDSFLAKPLFATNVVDEFERIARKNNMSLFEEKKRAELKGRRVLLAEDVLINAEIMKQLITMKEAEIEHAANGRIAVEMFAGHEPGYYDAILMDVRMPEMDGLEATKAIRALDRADAKRVPIIAMTANAFDEDVQRSLQVGFYLDREKDIVVELYMEGERLFYVIRTPNHHTGNLITNLARLCGLETSAGRKRPEGDPGRGALLFRRGQPAGVHPAPGGHEGGQHLPGRAGGAEGLGAGHLQDADEPDQGLPPGHRKDHRQDLHPQRLQVPHRPAHPHERQPAAGRADRPGHRAPDPLSLLLHQEAGPAVHAGADRPAGGGAGGGGAVAGGHPADGPPPGAAHRRLHLHQLRRPDPGQPGARRRRTSSASATP